MEDKKPIARVCFTRYEGEEDSFHAEVEGAILPLGNLLANGLASLLLDDDPLTALVFRHSIEMAVAFAEDEKEDNTDDD